MNPLRIRLLASTGALMLILFRVSSAIAATTLNFEDKAAGAVISKSYANLGVVVGPNPGVIDTQPKPHSGAHLLAASHGEFYSGPFVITFSSGQSHVSLFAGAVSDQNQAVRGTVRALDINGNQIAQDGPRLTVANACATLFDLKVGSPTIARIEIFLATTDQNGNQTELPEAIDDLTFEGDPPPPVAKTPPVVQITSPVDQQQLDAAVFIVTGTVTGAGLPQTVTLTLEVQQPQNQPHLPPLVTLVPLGGNGQALTFSVPVKLGLGPQTLTVEAENDGGLKGRAQVQFTNLATVITAQFGASGGVGTFGTLEWVVAGGGCTLAVYDHGTISYDGGATRTVLDGIFDKWLQWILAKYSQIYVVGVGSFCPTEDERNAPGASRAQTFRKGRIYTQLAAGTIYVPAVFAQAIDTLGGEAATGVPLTDPKSAPAAKTWLFQQFVRPGSKGLASTLEIKGDPPALWVERQGGDLTALAEVGQPITAASPTLVQSFPCDSGEGPCTVTAPSSPAGVPRADSAGLAYCDGQTAGGITPEWSAIQGDYTITPLLGIVKASFMSDKDLPSSHENIYEGALFPSDWVVLVVPVHPFKSVLARNKDIEVEVEEYFANYFFVGWGFPQAGDLFFAGGRWIIDCGHDSFNSEIHPPFVTADMRTQDGISGNETVANIWVNGFYTGGAVDIDLFPPPRPAPNSFLAVNKPVDAQAAVDVTVTFTTDPDFSTFVRPHFVGSPRHVTVTYTGEMKYQNGRGYMGRWTVGWQTQGQIPIQDLNNNWWP